MKIEPFSYESQFEMNCDVVRDWLSEDQILCVAQIETSSLTGNFYDEEGVWDEKKALISNWDSMIKELIAQDLIGWEKLKEFYKANQRVIIKTFLPCPSYQKLYGAIADGYEIESCMACMAAFAVYHWCFGYWYRANRLEHLSKRRKSTDSSTSG
jgi:hypothetical protein